MDREGQHIMGRGSICHGRGSKYHMGRGFDIHWERGVKIPWIEDSIYHRKGGQNIMDKRAKIPWVGDRYAMGRGVKMPCIGVSIYHA